jgi:uncharacterized membrane protein (UPF0127 family)
MAGQATVTIRNKQWDVSVATAPWELTKGLGGLASMPAGSGMLFDLGYPQTIQVTTVPMFFPLDIAFLSDTLVITEVYRDIEPGYLVTSTLSACYFLEVNAGELEGIDSGDRASVELLPPSGVMALPDWTSAVVNFTGFMVMGILIVGIVKDLVKGMLEEPEKRPELLPQTEAIFRPGEIVKYKGEGVRVLEHIGDRVSIWIPSRQEETWVKPEKLERMEPAQAVGEESSQKKQERQVVLSSLVFGELTGAGLGYVAKEVSNVVDKRSRDNAWLELWDGTTFDRVGGYREHIGLTIPRLVVAEIGIRTGLTYNECVAIAERIDGKLKEADAVVLDDGSTFRKSYVPVKKSPAVVPDKQKENLAAQILKGLSTRDGYRAYVKFPKDKSAFITIGAIVGGHYSWNPAGFTVWVDAYERNLEWPPDHILAIKELRRPRSFEATEQGVKQALDYLEKEFPTFTETMWVSKSIPLYVAYELGILKKEAAPEWLPGVVVMPRIPEEARKDVLFVEYIRDLVRLGQRVSDEEVKVMWKAWQKRELSKLPHTEFLRKQIRNTGLIGQAISTNKAPNNGGEVMEYRVEENKPYGTWAIVELWPTGTVRSPFKTGEEAINREEEIGQYYGWKLKRVEFTPQQISLLDPQRFPRRTEALVKLRGYDVIEVHDDGDLTVRSRGKFYVVTTGGQTFEQQYLPRTHQVRPKLIPVEKPKAGKTDLEFLPDSPEFLAYTIEDIGYREKIDSAFQQAIARAKGSRQWQ